MLLGGEEGQFVSIKTANLRADPTAFSAVPDEEDDDSPLPPRAADAAAAPSASAEELAALPVKELKKLAAAAGLDTVGCVEKGDFVALLVGSE